MDLIDQKAFHGIFMKTYVTKSHFMDHEAYTFVNKVLGRLLVKSRLKKSLGKTLAKM
jgi:hypothetical protein